MIKLFSKISFVLFLTNAFIFPVLAQNNSGELSGRVTDANQAAVANATVKARIRTGGAEISAQTDAAGNFQLMNLAAGEYRVTVTAAGFSDSAREITVGDGGTADLTFALSVGNISESVTVTATRNELVTTETAVPVSVVDRAELERRNPTVIGDIFRDLPGTESVGEGAFQVRPRIRGLDSNRVLVLVDGERLNNARTSTSQSGIELGLVETDQIETVEVARGAGSVLYGTDALAGTVNIITRETPRRNKDGFRFGGSFNGFYSSNENGARGSLAVNGTSKFFAFRLAQSRESFDNYFAGKDGIQDGVTTDGEVLNSQSHGSNSQATLRFFVNNNNDFKFNYERRRASDIGSPSLVGVFSAYFPFSDRDKFSARYEGANFTEYLARVSASFYYQRQKRDFANILNVPAAPPFFPGIFQYSETVTDTKTFGFDAQSNWILGSKNFLTAGFSFFQDRNNDNRYIQRRNPNFAVFPPTLTFSEDRSKSVPNATFGSFAAFGQDEYEVTRKLKLVGGLRVDFFRSQAEQTSGFALPSGLTASQIEDLDLTDLTSGLKVNQTAVTGDFGVVYKLTNNISLTGRVGRSFRVPNLFERFFTDAGSIGGFVVGNPNLEPESGINVDVGAKFSTAKFAGSVTYFNNNYRNFLSSVIARDRNGVPIRLINPGAAPIDVFQTVNIGKARIQGFEAEIEFPFKVAGGFLTPNGNFSYLRGDNRSMNEPLDTITPFKTVAGLRYEDTAKRFYGEFNTRIVGKQERLSSAYLITNGGAEPGFTESDIRGGYNFRRERFRIGINAGLNNIFNRYYSEQFNIAPARGRSFTIGTTLEIF